MKYWLSFIFSLLLSLSVNAQQAKDFVELLMNDLKEQYQEAENEEYGCVTVSPFMMEKMLEIMQTNNSQDNDLIERLISHVKSMRIFSATKNIDRYHAEAQQLLEKNEKQYKAFQADAQKKDTQPCVWIRKSGQKVVEMIVLNLTEGQNFIIINLTGNMDKAFIDELLKM